MAGWMIKLGGTYLVPMVNLLHEHMLEDPLIHCDETRLQVLKSDKDPLRITGCGCARAAHPAGGSFSLTMTPPGQAPYRYDCSKDIGASSSPTAMRLRGRRAGTSSTLDASRMSS